MIRNLKLIPCFLVTLSLLILSSLPFASVPNAFADSVCDYDMNYDLDVDGADLALFAADFSAGQSDLGVFASEFGQTDCSPVLLLTAPDGGEHLQAGSWFEIAWIGSAGITLVDIDLLIYPGDDGICDLNSPPDVLSIASATPDDGSYNWAPVPFHDLTRLSNCCKLRIRDAEHPDTVFDLSDDVFVLGPPSSPMTQEELYVINEDMEADPDHTDSDNDGFVDNVELYLGTDQFHWDTDRDGYGDRFEIMPEIPGPLPLKDEDNDGLIASLDNDDNNDQVNDGRNLDSDLDSIYNYLELYGYVYNFPFIEPWDGDITVRYFKTDPLKVSTDRDPYSDYDEAINGPGMDDFVKSPGDHPNIPTLPNIVIMPRVQDGKWWDVTLNQTITTTEGTSRAEGSEWSEDTYNLTETTDEYHWEVTQEVSYSLSDFGGSTSVSYGQSHSTGKTTGTVKSEGGSILNTDEWSTATCSNPLEAASIKFYLKAVNVGTCPVADPVLDVNLVIGDKEVLRFKLEDLPTIDAGGEYEFVLDLYNDFLPSKYLTLDELRALDTGVPISFRIYDILGGTVLGAKPGQEDRWEYYQLNADEVCARLYIDLGDGNTTEQLIYAGQGEQVNEPRVTLLDALVWAANAHLIEEAPGVWRPYAQFYQPGGGLGDPAPMDGWYFKLDPGTFSSIRPYIHNPDFNLFDTVLTSDSVVVAKAPPREPTPRIHWAVIDSPDGIVKAYVNDYFFTEDQLDVYFVDKNGVWNLMEWDPDKLYFSCACDRYYYKGGTEKFIARNRMYGPEDPRKWETELPVSEAKYIPPNPYVGSYDTPGYAYSVFVLGDYAYVADGNSGLQVIDIHDPASPTLAGAFGSFWFPYDLFVLGNYAYFVERGSLLIIDISDPAKLSLIGTTETSCVWNSVFIQSNYAYLVGQRCGELCVCDVSDPAIPIPVGGVDISGAVNIFIQGNYAYIYAFINDYTDTSLLVFDISDPVYPALTGMYNMSGEYSGHIFVQGHYAYVPHGSSLLVIDVSDPANPTLESACATTGVASGVFVSDGYAFVAEGEAGVEVIDVTDPANPAIIHNYDTPGLASAVFVQGDYVYVADGTSGLQILRFK